MGLRSRKGFYGSDFGRATLEPLRGDVRSFRFVGFDIETFGDFNEFYSAGLFWLNDKGEECFEYFRCRLALGRALFSRRFKGYKIFATNLGFDLSGAFFGTEYWNRLEMVSRGSDLLSASFDLGNNHGKITILDTMNFVPFSVEKMGKILGSFKVSKPSFWIKDSVTGFYEATKPSNADEEAELEFYNRMDCKISHDFMVLLQRGYNELGGTLKITGASTAMDIFRRRFQHYNMTKETYFIKSVDGESVRDFIFRGYYGGRTEVFKRGFFRDLYYYDINSLYPSVMRNRFPLPQSVKKVPYADVMNIKRYEGVSECVVICPSGLNKPFLPVKHGGKLIFPSGEFRGVWNHNELRYAISLGYLVKPLKQIIYTKTFKPFDDYVNTIYDKRLEYKRDGSSLELATKLALNSLYGKFAMKRVTKAVIKDISMMDFEEKMDVLRGDSDIKGDMSIKVTETPYDGKVAFPILSSYITSYARILMFPFINRDDCVYTDTDSVFLSGEVSTGSKLGDMKLECVVSRGIFVRPKFYMIDDDIKVKGVSSASYREFMGLLRGVSVKKLKFTKIRESVRRGLKPNTKLAVDKFLNLEDTKRSWSHKMIDVINSNVLRYATSEPLVMELFCDENVLPCDLEKLESNAEKAKLSKIKRYDEKVKRFIRENPLIKNKFIGKAQLLRGLMVSVLDKGMDLDLVDWFSLDSENAEESLYSEYNINIMEELVR